jgi:hypothetical protein
MLPFLGPRISEVRQTRQLPETDALMSRWRETPGATCKIRRLSKDPGVRKRDEIPRPTSEQW